MQGGNQQGVQPMIVSGGGMQGTGSFSDQDRVQRPSNDPRFQRRY